jgi:prepilin-type N-terminal cleavage/methylation domain-containing protein
VSLKMNYAPKAFAPLQKRTGSESGGRPGFLISIRRSLTHKRRSGYSMVEIAVAMLVLSILAAIGFSSLRRVRSRGKSGAMIAMLESYEKSLWMYCQHTGHYPPETAGGRDPGFLSNVHTESNWGGPYANRTGFNFGISPIGGQWDWNNNEGNEPSPESPGVYLISVGEGSTPIDHTAGQFVDDVFDDGNLDTGKWVRSRWSSAYSYVLKPREECIPE